MAATRLGLITTSFLFVGANAYNKVGVERFCNIDPEEFTAQCNYESFGSCQSYLSPGQRCIANADYSAAALKIARREPDEPLWKLWLRNFWTDLQDRLRARF